jgi:hypothetical protein
MDECPFEIQGSPSGAYMSQPRAKTPTCYQALIRYCWPAPPFADVSAIGCTFCESGSRLMDGGMTNG